MDNSNQSVNESEIEHFSAEEIEERIYKFNGDEIIKKYVKGKFLGKGGFAKCYELKCLNNKRIYAAKIVAKNNLSKQSTKQKLKSEIKIHKSLFHNHIVKFEHVFEDNQNVYILLELCKNKSLNEMVKKRKILTELEVRYYLDQILKALRFMHKNRIIHRDLKLGNLFINENMEIKIGDFGLATTISFEGEKRHTICGTPNYIAPEILEGKSTGHSFEVDFWAIGVIVYTLLLGRPPFETDDVKETYKRIHNNIYTFPGHIYITEEAKDFIKKILVTNPQDRLNVEGMRAHPFLSNHIIPKSLPQSVINLPPDYNFYRKLQVKPITNANEISFLNDSASYNNYLQDLIDFAKKNLKEVECQKVNENILIASSDHAFINSNVLKYKNLNLSQNKENHNLLKIKKQTVDLTQINYVDTLVDYSSSFGFLFLMNNNIAGVYFNDKCTIHKFLSEDEFSYNNKKANMEKNFNIRHTKDIPSDIKAKLNLLINYEKFTVNGNLNNKNTSNRRNIYVKKVIVTDMAYVFKLSNNVIELIFADKSKIIIDNYETRSVIFFDKNNKMVSYDVQLVNKCNNKKLLKRYDHYKKIFYEKMEERFMRHQQRTDLNKTL